ncbi:MAG: pantoate--beta-alanine ligase [Bacteroidota bacterium]
MAVLVRDVKEMQRTAESLRSQGKRIGVVPTMGYLHKGHLKLIEVAKQHADVVVTTNFVNPTQFGPAEDFSRYPRDLGRDTELASRAGTDIVFAPDTTAMYPDGYATYVEVERLTNVLEGRSRPGHFRGVATIVAKLFNITRPHVAVFGQKDAQQVVVVRQMLKDLDFDIDLIVCPIVREADGLAMSSRNTYLSPEQRLQATALFKSLKLAEELIKSGERQSPLVLERMVDLITRNSSGVIDYISIADAMTLQELTQCKGPLLISLAVRFGSTRLIDNTTITV